MTQGLVDKLDLQVWLGLLIFLFLYILASFFFSRLGRKNTISRAVLGFSKWLFLLVGLYFCDLFLFPSLDVHIPRSDNRKLTKCDHRKLTPLGLVS